MQANKQALKQLDRCQ